jgi:hypothetical protein
MEYRVVQPTFIPMCNSATHALSTMGEQGNEGRLVIYDGSDSGGINNLGGVAELRMTGAGQSSL